MRKMLYVLMLAAIVSGPLFAAQVEERFDVSPGGLLEVDLETGGSLEIRGWDQNVVLVRATSEDKDSDGQEISIRKTADGVLVEAEATKKWGRGNSHGYDLVINVPKVYDLEIETMGGDIEVNGVEGKLEGETMGGDLKLSELKGDLKFETMGGDIELTDSDVDGEIETMGGDVTVANVVGDVDGSSMGGNVVYKNVTRRSGESSSKAVVISTMGGDIEVGSAPAGASLETMGGDIAIGDAAEFVEAETMGGDITIGSIDGRVEAETMGGNVKVTVIGDPQAGNKDIELTSMGGEIHLTVPRNFSMAVEIEIAYNEKSGVPKIISDAPLAIENREGGGGFLNRESSTLSGSGSFNGGKNKVEIETVGGNVYLKYAN
jgi:DUF4097 and DUF4098 domain-containing protein YvlB